MVIRNNNYECSVKIKENLGSHKKIVDSFKDISPEDLLILLNRKYVSKKNVHSIIQEVEDEMVDFIKLIKKK